MWIFSNTLFYVGFKQILNYKIAKSNFLKQKQFGYANQELKLIKCQLRVKYYNYFQHFKKYMYIRDCQ